MSTTLEQYREAKSNYQKLKNQAKKELIARFNELASELLQVQRELLDDFGERIAMPKARKAKAAKPASKAEPGPEPPPVQAPSPQAVAIEKQLAGQRKKLATAQAANKPTKVIDDRIYELEDALRLLREK
jgi:hypothetical protein